MDQCNDHDFQTTAAVAAAVVVAIIYSKYELQKGLKKFLLTPVYIYIYIYIFFFFFWGGGGGGGGGSSVQFKVLASSIIVAIKHLPNRPVSVFLIEFNRHTDPPPPLPHPPPFIPFRNN